MRRNAAIASLLGGLAATPVGMFLWVGLGPALIVLGSLLLLVALLLGWGA